MDILKALAGMETLGTLTARLYEKYSMLFKGDKEASGFFFGLSLDEKSHVELIRYQIRLIKKSPKEFAEVDADMNAIEKITGFVKNALESDIPPSLEDAVKTAVTIETDRTEKYFRSLMEQSNPNVSLLLESLGIESKDHHDTIFSFAMSHGWLPEPDAIYYERKSG